MWRQYEADKLPRSFAHNICWILEQLLALRFILDLWHTFTYFLNIDLHLDRWLILSNSICHPRSPTVTRSHTLSPTVTHNVVTLYSPCVHSMFPLSSPCLHPVITLSSPCLYCWVRSFGCCFELCTERYLDWCLVACFTQQNELHMCCYHSKVSPLEPASKLTSPINNS